MDTGSGGGGLSVGAIVGIALAAFALVVLMPSSSIFIILLYWFCWRPPKTNQGIFEVHETTNMNCVHAQM